MGKKKQELTDVLNDQIFETIHKHVGKEKWSTLNDLQVERIGVLLDALVTRISSELKAQEKGLPRYDIGIRQSGIRI